MKIRPLIALVALLGCTAGLALAQSPASPPAFSARSVQTTPEQPDRIGAITKSGGFLRLEFKQDGQDIIQILRPADGISYVLYPQTRSYLESTIPVQPEEFAESYTAPCPALAEENGLQCRRLGLDVYQSIPVERWLVSASDEGQMLILWDPKRKRALRQEMPNGVVLQMTFLEQQPLEGRPAEHWVTEITRQGAVTQRTEWWYDPELRLVLRETLPGNTLRYLDQIIIGPVDPALFSVPDGWQRLSAPNPAPQE